MKIVAPSVLRSIASSMGMTVGSDRLQSRLMRATAGSLALKVTGVAGGFVTSFLLARALGAAGYGAYAYALSWATLLAVPSILGLDMLSVRNLSAYRARESWDLARGLAGHSFAVVLAISVIIGLGGVVVVSAIFSTNDPRFLPLAIGMALVPLTALTRLGEATLRGLHHLVIGQLPEYLIRPALLTGLILAAMLVLRSEFTAAWAVGLTVGAAGVGLLVGGWLVISRLPSSLRQAVPRHEMRVWMGSALPLLLISSMRIINNETDVLMLGTLIGTDAAGIYRVAARGADLIAFVLTAVNLALAPTVADLYARGEIERLQRVVTGSARAILVLSLPVAVLLMVFGNAFMGVFGPEFVSGSPALAILSATQLVNASAGSVALTLTMTGHERATAAGLLTAAIINVALNVALIPWLGVTGAAIATGTSTVLWNAILVIQVYRLLHIHSTALGVVRWPKR